MRQIKRADRTVLRFLHGRDLRFADIPDFANIIVSETDRDWYKRERFVKHIEWNLYILITKVSFGFYFFLFSFYISATAKYMCVNMNFRHN